MEPPPQAPRPKILVADRLPTVVKMMRNTLERAGYNVITASGYQEAVAISRAERPDLIVIDLMMPDTPMFMEGDLPAPPPPKPERRGCLPFLGQPARRERERTAFERRLFPDDETAIPPYPVDTFIRSLQSVSETCAPPVVLTVNMGGMMPHWSWEGTTPDQGSFFDTDPFTYLVRPYTPSELLSLVQRLLPAPGP